MSMEFYFAVFAAIKRILICFLVRPQCAELQYVRDEEHINAHFLTCFITLTILRLIQKKTQKEYSAEKIIDCLNKIECMHEHENIYLFNYRDKISDALGAAFGIDFTKKRLRLTEIKKILGEAKNSLLCYTFYSKHKSS